MEKGASQSFTEFSASSCRAYGDFNCLKFQSCGVYSLWKKFIVWI